MNVIYQANSFKYDYHFRLARNLEPRSLDELQKEHPAYYIIMEIE